MRSAFALLLMDLVLVLAPAAALAQFDAAGNYLAPGGGHSTGEGESCGSCPAPNLQSQPGVDFKGFDLIVYDGGSQIRRLQNCGVVETVTLTLSPAFGFDIGYDSTRDLYVVSDAGSARLLTYAPNGNQVGAFGALGNPVGACYDASRDVYWSCDWITNRIYAINASSGAIGPVFVAPAGTRIAGTGYDATADAIVYNARDQATGHWMSASDGSLIGDYVIPLAGENNGEGCGVDPLTTNVWIGHYEEPSLFCISGLGGPIAVAPTSWGGLKNLYR